MSASCASGCAPPPSRGRSSWSSPSTAPLELASLAGEDNARDPERSLDAVSARIKDVDDLHGSLAREFGVHICAASGPVRREGDREPVNRARLFAPDGSFGVQDKLILDPLRARGVAASLPATRCGSSRPPSAGSAS